jgi:uncharacterized protein
MSQLRALLGNWFTRVAIAFELSLGLAGCLLSWAFGSGPLMGARVVDLHAVWRDTGLGMAATLPFLAGLVLMDRYPIGVLQPLARTVREDVVPLFRGTGAAGLVGIACAAGVGEEFLFRGFLQQTVAAWSGLPAGPWIALAIASVAFGICHSLCAEYAVLATMMGLVLGGLFLATGHLLAPIVMHALYDSLALLYLVRWSPASTVQ